VAEVVAEHLEAKVAGPLECLERGLCHVGHVEFFADSFVHEFIPQVEEYGCFSGGIEVAVSGEELHARPDKRLLKLVVLFEPDAGLLRLRWIDLLKRTLNQDWLLWLFNFQFLCHGGVIRHKIIDRWIAKCFAFSGHGCIQLSQIFFSVLDFEKLRAIILFFLEFIIFMILFDSLAQESDIALSSFHLIERVCDQLRSPLLQHVRFSVDVLDGALVVGVCVPPE